MDEWWRSVRARLSGWLAPTKAAADPVDSRPRVHVESPRVARLRSRQPSRHRPPGDREGEYERLQDEVSRLAHPDDLPPAR
jgi:hypothetical protein